jgi:hypothetical protein
MNTAAARLVPPVFLGARLREHDSVGMRARASEPVVLAKARTHEHRRGSPRAACVLGCSPARA